jgi:hypothetical protein
MRVLPELLRLSLRSSRGGLATVRPFVLHLPDDHSQAQYALRQHILIFPLLYISIVRRPQ